jgi:muconolactone delta-isomerase
VQARYHLVGSHGGAWMYDVASNEELDALLAQAPVYNVAIYQVYPLAEERGPTRSEPRSRRSRFDWADHRGASV